MRRLVKQVKDLFTPKEIQGIDAYEVLDVLGDPVIRKTWLYEVMQEIKRINQSIDSKLMNGDMLDIADLSARRRALQFVLEAALSAKREVARAKGHNPLGGGDFDLESVTVLPSPK